MDIEITAKEKRSKGEVQIIIHDVPDEATQGELLRYFRLYQAQAGSVGDWEVVGFAKITFESGNEQKALDE